MPFAGKYEVRENIGGPNHKYAVVVGERRGGGLLSVCVWWEVGGINREGGIGCVLITRTHTHFLLAPLVAHTVSQGREEDLKREPGFHQT